MFKCNKLFLLTCLYLVASPLFAQSLDKPFEKWSRDDAMKLLSNSSWAQTYQSTEGAAAADAANARGSLNDNRVSGTAGTERGRSEVSGGPPPVVIRLHSGLPVRHAIMRLNQIAAGYDKMDDKGKASFNESGRKLIECAICQNYYVVTLTQIPNPSGQFIEEAIFQGMTVQQMKGNIWLLNDKGERRELIQFSPPLKRGDAAVFFFARKDDKGSVFLTKDISNFSFVFSPTFLVKSNPFAYLVPRKFDFRVSKITFGENIHF